MSTDAISQIQELAPKLSPRAFHRRMDYWRRASFPAGGLSERVGGSRGHKLPAFDPTDARLNEAEAQYREAWDGAADAWNARDFRLTLKLLRKCELLEQVWLVPIAVLDGEALKALDGMISDAASCMCSNTKELWERGKHRTPWRLKAGLGPCCYSGWRAAGAPDKTAWLKLNRPLEAEAS